MRLSRGIHVSCKGQRALGLERTSSTRPEVGGMTWLEWAKLARKENGDRSGFLCFVQRGLVPNFPD